MINKDFSRLLGSVLAATALLSQAALLRAESDAGTWPRMQEGMIADITVFAGQPIRFPVEAERSLRTHF